MTEEIKIREVASKVASIETGKLIADHAPSDTTPAHMKALVAKLAAAKQAKAEFTAANAFVLAQKAEVDKTVRESEREIYAGLAHAAATMDDETFAAYSKELPEELGYTPRYEVHGDDAEILAFCMKYFPVALMVNRDVFNAFVEALAKMPKREKQPEIAIPATYVKTTLPTVSDKIGATAEADDDEQS